MGYGMITTFDNTLLHNLPWGISIWAALLLSWGFYLSLLVKHNVQVGKPTIISLREIPFIHFANIMSLSYIVFGPFIEKYINDTFIVFNIFYTTFLIAVSLSLLSNKLRNLVTTIKNHFHFS